MEGEKGEWGFKAYKQMVKLQFKQKRYEAMMSSYKEMLTYIKCARRPISSLATLPLAPAARARVPTQRRRWLCARRA